MEFFGAQVIYVMEDATLRKDVSAVDLLNTAHRPNFEHTHSQIAVRE